MGVRPRMEGHGVDRGREMGRVAHAGLKVRVPV